MKIVRIGELAWKIGPELDVQRGPGGLATARNEELGQAVGAEHRVHAFRVGAPLRPGFPRMPGSKLQMQIMADLIGFLKGM